MPVVENNRRKIVARLARDGWVARQDGGHDVFKHAYKPGRIIVPRHQDISLGVSRAIAKQAGWI